MPRGWGDPEPGPYVGIVGALALWAFLVCWGGLLIAVAVRWGN